MASMNDVARRAGVSIATVSRVLNNSSSVNDETRSKILKAIKDLKYQPSRVAKRLRSKGGPSNLLGVLIPDIRNPFYVDVLLGIEDIAYKNNYAIIMCNFSQDEKKEAMYLEILESEAIDGLIAAPANEDDVRLKRIVNNGLPQWDRCGCGLGQQRIRSLFGSRIFDQSRVFEHCAYWRFNFDPVKPFTRSRLCKSTVG